MHNTVIIMKDGAKYCGPMYLFKPEEGWMSLGGEEPDCGPNKIFFRDMASAVTKDERVGVIRDNTGRIIGPRIADVDEIARARECGWDGS